MQNAPQRTYDEVRTAILSHRPDLDLLSYNQLTRRIERLTGITSHLVDMCENTCIAFTGPYAHLDKCPYCDTSRYDQKKLEASGGKERVARQFDTFLLGPQLQAQMRSVETATALRYLHSRANQVIETLNKNGGALDEYGDICDGEDMVDCFACGDIGKNDFILMLSVDGAQLYQNKQSDCWIYIWVILNHLPETRYKKKYVLPGGIIPGPNKPKNLDSFLFPGLYHIAALQKEGLSIFDASQGL